ncbi:MAG TPA: GNAT family N-acetyltransferase [Bacteroidetes bacterium]|nr:GNAT family N-acetyltransferase [Bacteroidota bacterium]
MQKSNLSIFEAKTGDELLAVFDVMKQLRTHLKRSEFVAQVRRQEAAGYRIAALRRGEEVVAVTGFRLTENLAMGSYVYIDDLVTLDTGRSEGYGALLMEWVGQWAREQGCSELHLDSGVQRFDAHRFYFRERMAIVFYHFRKYL